MVEDDISAFEGILQRSDVPPDVKAFLIAFFEREFVANQKRLTLLDVARAVVKKMRQR